MIIRSFLLIIIISSLLVVEGQEVVSPLGYNPQLYWKQQKNIQAGINSSQKRTVSGNYLFVPDTLSLPFKDDFSKNHLISLTPGTSLGTIKRSVELGETVKKFYGTDTAWMYSYNIMNHSVDSVPLPTVDSLILNDDVCGNPLLETDVVYRWTDYQRPTYDSSGNVITIDTISPDSFLVRYSELEVVLDQKPSLWMDRYVFINNTFSNDPLSYGVATFDGLNEFGLPHNGGSSTVHGPADTLTSKCIDLSGLGPADSVFLSFYYQPQGLGNRPDEGDSLILEFKAVCDWEELWATDGFSTRLDDPQFKQVLIYINKPIYFTNSFQFRFRNYATISGNNDHWNLDYVYLDKNRGFIDTVVGDAAVVYPPTNFLVNYTAMPWDQFKGFEAIELANNFSLSYRNNYITPINLNLRYKARESLTQTGLYSNSLTISPFENDSTYMLPFPTSDFFPYSPANDDSVVISIQSTFDEFPTDFTQENDTATLDVKFFNYYAYDDGSAEKAYGLEGLGLKKFAYKFNLNHPDTLRAIQIHFTKIDNFNLALLREFSLMVWKEIGMDGMEEDTLYVKDGTEIFYIDNRNGFATYVLDTPIAVSSHFYLGWQQVFEENMQVGLDVNNSAQQHMFIYTSGNWKASLVEGAPMIRPVVGKKVPLMGTAIEDVQETRSITIYPNPVYDRIYLDLSGVKSYWVRVVDLSGKLLESRELVNAQVDVSGLHEGLYILMLTDLKEHKTQSFRFVKM